MRPSAAVASDFTQLVLHVLAHVRIDGPGSLFDPRYVAWVGEHAPPSLVQQLHEDAAALERVWSTAPPSDVVHAWPQLFTDLEAMVSAAARPLSEVRPDQVQAPQVLACLQAERSVAVELLHASLGALAPEHARWWGHAIGPRLDAARGEVQPLLAIGHSSVLSLGAHPVELAWSLGPRGRAFASRIVVGSPAPWHSHGPATSVVLALHERAVLDAGQVGYVAAEWSALRGVAARMHAAPMVLRQAHGSWLAGLELGPLVAGARVAGLLDETTAQRLQAEPETRAEVLAQMGPPSVS
ncbi:MAG: hypothetical protein K0V04_22975 [Deltaproteobacteria bacterium]|nr:hypothetical protein [Deltaproteobacteria bacterium]